MRMKRGDLIIESKPFIYKLSVLWRGQRCETCLEVNPSLKKCTKCKLTFYCSKQCQRADWIDHKYECDKIGAACLQERPPESPHNATDFLFVLSRLIQKHRREGDKESETIGNVTRTFADLMSHEEELRNDKERYSAVRNAYVGLKQYMGCTLSFDQVLPIAGKLIINSLSIMEEIGSLMPLGTGVYFGPSVIDHSCRPNAYYVFDGPTLIIRSVVDHDDFDISKVFVPYIPVISVRAVRQKALLEQYFFVCKCAWCEDDSLDQRMQSIYCENSACHEPVYVQSDECWKCGTPVNPTKRSDALFIIDELEKTMSNLSKMKTDGRFSDAVNSLTNVLDKAKPLLHPLNVAYMNGCNVAFDMCVFQEDLKRALAYGLRALQGYRAYQEGMYPSLGGHLMKVGGAQCQSGDRQEGRKKMQEALEIITILFGKDNSFTKTIRAFN